MYFYCKACENFTEFLLYEFLKKWNMQILLDFILDNVILKSRYSQRTSTLWWKILKGTGDIEKEQQRENNIKPNNEWNTNNNHFVLPNTQSWEWEITKWYLDIIQVLFSWEILQF